MRLGRGKQLPPLPLFHRQGLSWQAAVLGTGPGSKPVWPIMERRLAVGLGYPVYIFTGSSIARAGASSPLGPVARGIWQDWLW